MRPSRHLRTLVRLLLPLWLIFHGAVAQDFTGDIINLIRGNMNASSTTSWEMGTATQALLEYDLTSFSVFAPSPAFSPSGSLTVPSIDPVLYFARRALQQRNGTSTIIKDGAAGDPASLGVAVILGNLSGADTGISNLTFHQVADQEIEFLLSSVPRAPNGAISHRVSEVSLWSDFIYMVPPFFAYYGVVTGNTSMINEAFNQISLYRNQLLVSKTNLWKHVVLGTSFDDLGLWATGNAWAAAGILRVLATIQNSPYSSQFKRQRSDLANWATEIHNGFYSRVDKKSFLTHNYINDSSTFLEAASATLMASSVFRLAVLSNSRRHVPNAISYRSSLIAGSHAASIDSNGWLTPVVNPYSFVAQGSNSPESESFVLLMESAYRDWVQDGKKGVNSAAPRIASTGTSVMASLVVVIVGAVLL